MTFRGLQQLVKQLLDNQRQKLSAQNETLAQQSQEIEQMKHNITAQSQTNRELSIETKAMKANITEIMAENEQIQVVMEKSRHDDYFGFASDLKKNGFQLP